MLPSESEDVVVEKYKRDRVRRLVRNADAEFGRALVLELRSDIKEKLHTKEGKDTRLPETFPFHTLKPSNSPDLFIEMNS